jgi:hypothetical protein
LASHEQIAVCSLTSALHRTRPLTPATVKLLFHGGEKVETAIGVILSALATILASRYYFLRSIKKSLGVFRLLNSFVFEGIAPDMCKQLHFRSKTRR